MKALIIDDQIQIICPETPPPGEKYPDGSRVVEVEVCPYCRGARYVEKPNLQSALGEPAKSVPFPEELFKKEPA